MSSADIDDFDYQDPTVEPGLEPPSFDFGERMVVGDIIEVAPDPDEFEIIELTDQERADFAMLLTCGRRSKKITVMGHPVVIATLNTADEMRIGLYTKKYLDSQMGFQRAYQVAVCAAGIREVQGKPLVSSLRQITDEDELFDKKVEAVKEYYPVVITQIYEAIMDLEREFADIAAKLGKLGKLEG